VHPAAKAKTPINASARFTALSKPTPGSIATPERKTARR
jgi:hypothetical protein